MPIIAKDDRKRLTRQEQVIWAAGFLDGEGWFGAAGGGKDRVPILTVSAAQVDPAPILLLRGLFGGKVRLHRSKQPNAADAYQWTVKGVAAVRLCKEIFPFLVVKCEHAEIGAAFGRLMPGKGRPLPIGILEQRREVQRILSDLNRRGVPRGRIHPDKDRNTHAQIYLLPRKEVAS